MKENIVGMKFGKLTVLRQVESKGKGREFECKCDCGTISDFTYRDLKHGNNKSCGCLHHRKSYTPIYQTWSNMKRRCKNPKNKSFHRYGGRGITYDPRWEDFNNFYADMGETYQEGLSLDRIDFNGNYTKENCRWADKETQANNTVTNHFITYKGETLTIAQMCRKHNVNQGLFMTRFYHQKLSVEEAMERPVERETIVYNGIEKTVSEYAKEYGMTYTQLKKRLMRDWDIERALTQPLRKR